VICIFSSPELVAIGHLLDGAVAEPLMPRRRRDDRPITD